MKLRIAKEILLRYARVPASRSCWACISLVLSRWSCLLYVSPRSNMRRIQAKKTARCFWLLIAHARKAFTQGAVSLCLRLHVTALTANIEKYFLQLLCMQKAESFGRKKKHRVITTDFQRAKNGECGNHDLVHLPVRIYSMRQYFRIWGSERMSTNMLLTWWKCLSILTI